MKILYAASTNANSKIQLSRFLMAMVGSKHQIKIAAHKSSSPRNVSVSWTLDALMTPYDRTFISASNDNLAIYYDQVKSYAPDLIISDLDYYTSYVAMALDIPLWQCSASLVNYAMTAEAKYGLGVFKIYAATLSKDPMKMQRIVNIIDNSNCNFVYSHYGDLITPVSILPKYEWIRPYHQVYELYKPCRHNIVAAIANNKRILHELNKHEDGVVFTDCCHETYERLVVKDIYSSDEYYCNLRNAAYFVCQGQTCFLADAFYNGQFALIWPDYNDIDSVLNTQLAQKVKLGSVISAPINLAHTEEIVPHYNEGIKYLHEKIDEL